MQGVDVEKEEIKLALVADDMIGIGMGPGIAKNNPEKQNQSKWVTLPDFKDFYIAA